MSVLYLVVSQATQNQQVPIKYYSSLTKSHQLKNFGAEKPTGPFAQRPIASVMAFSSWWAGRLGKGNESPRGTRENQLIQDESLQNMPLGEEPPRSSQSRFVSV